MEEDGYPTEETLEEIKNYPIHSHENCVELLEKIYNLWYYDQPYKNFYEKDHHLPMIGGKVKVFEFSTGGWSGNEELIKAMKDNEFFWILSWYSSRKGGHYVFEVRK